jgi:hypothetical protein
MHKATTGLILAALGLWIILNDLQKQTEEQHQDECDILQGICNTTRPATI